MNIKITPSPLGGTVAAIASKSMAHRLLICAALSNSETEVICSETSADIDATAGCLRALGAGVSYDGGVFRVTPLKRPIPGERTLPVGESGSTLRFMLPVACALGAGVSFTLQGRLPSRPLSPLYEELIAHGCTLSPQGASPLRAAGQLTSGSFTIDGGVSSQFVSGLLFALPLLDGESRIEIAGTLESKPYVDMTVEALRAFGITVAGGGAAAYTVTGHQTYSSQGLLTVEGDWSNAAFWLCAGAAGGMSVTVTNLNANSLQGDKAVLEILGRFGAQLTKKDGSVTVSRGGLRGIAIDAGDTPDLIPVLAAVAAVAEGETVIRNAGRLRIKESDRLKTVTETLAALGADITETADGLAVRGKPQLTGGSVDAHGDHRIAMTAAVAAAACQAPVVIRGAEAVKKSYPGFFKDYAALGGCFEEVP